MAIKRVHDSLSRCDPTLYSNLYDVRKRSDIKQTSIEKTPSLPADTMEISRDKLKEEALSRLRHTSKYTIAQNGFIRIGKYLFLGVAFPPYFLLYGLPKWIFVEGLPAVFSVNMWMWKKVQQKAQKRFDAVANKVVQISQFIQKMTQHVLITPIARLTLEIRHTIRRMQDKINQLLRPIGKRIKVGLDKPLSKIIEQFKFVQKKFVKVREKWTQQAQAVAINLKENIEWIKQSPQIFLGWGQAQFQQWSQKALTWKTYWQGQFQPSQERALGATNWVSKQLKKGINSFKEPLLNFYQQQFQPRWQMLKKACEGKWQQTQDFCHQKQQKALVFLQTKQQKLQILSYQQWSDRLVCHLWMAKFPWFKKWLTHSIMRTMGEGGVKIYAFLAYSLLQGCSQLLQIVSVGTQMLSKFYQRLQSYVKKAQQKVLGFLKIASTFSGKFIFYALYYFLLFIMITAILCRWGVQALGESMHAISLVFKIKPSLINRR